MSLQRLISRVCIFGAAVGLLLSFDPAHAIAQNSSDITSILDNAGPPQNQGGGLRAIVDAEPPSGTKGGAELGRSTESVVTRR